VKVRTADGDIESRIYQADNA